MVHSGLAIQDSGLAATAEGKGDAAAMKDAVQRAARVAPATYFRVPQYEARYQALAMRQDVNFIPDAKKKQVGGRPPPSDRPIALNSGFSYLRLTRARLYLQAQESRLMTDGE